MDRRGFLKFTGATVASSLPVPARSRQEDVFDRFERRAREEGAEEVGFKEIGPRRLANAHFEGYELSLRVQENEQKVVFKANSAFIGCRTVDRGFEFASEFESRVNCRKMSFPSDERFNRFEVDDWVLVKQLRFVDGGEDLSDRPNRVFVSSENDDTVLSAVGYHETNEIVTKRLSEKLGFSDFRYPLD